MFALNTQGGDGQVAISSAGALPPPPSPQPPPTADQARYVALGDSYASGEGASESTFQKGTSFKDPDHPGATIGCHRSSTAWPEKVYRSQIDRIKKFTFVACSGATIADLYNRNDQWDSVREANMGPQLDSVTSTTVLTTLSVGGNDMGFERVLNDCSHSIASYFGSGDSGCRKVGREARRAVDNGKLLLQQGIPVAGHGPKKLEDVYVDIASKMATGGQLVVTGYPRLFAKSSRGYWSTKSANRQLSCRVGAVAGLASGVFISYRDAQWINESTGYFNEQVRAAVDVADRRLSDSHSGVTVTYAHPSATFTGHRFCGGDKWFNGVQFTPRRYPKRTSFHPNASGQKGYARSVIPLIER